MSKSSVKEYLRLSMRSMPMLIIGDLDELFYADVSRDSVRQS